MAWVGRCQVFGFCLYRVFSQGHEPNFSVCYIYFQVGYFCSFGHTKQFGQNRMGMSLDFGCFIDIWNGWTAAGMEHQGGSILTTSSGRLFRNLKWGQQRWWGGRNLWLDSTHELCSDVAVVYFGNNPMSPAKCIIFEYHNILTTSNVYFMMLYVNIHPE